MNQQQTVLSIADFKTKYGNGEKIHSLIKEFIRRSPNFPDDVVLADQIAEAFGDLKCALRLDKG
jgi:hypothetical protein